MVQKFELEGWNKHYFTGEVTEEDILIGEPEMKKRIDRESSSHNVVESTLRIELKPELRELLGYTTERRSSYDPVPGIIDIRASASCEKNTDRAIKAMRTRHRSECEAEFSPEQIDKVVKRLVNGANRTIAMSREDFVYHLSINMEGVENWDSKNTLEELADKRRRLQDQINGIESSMKALMRTEIDEWMKKKGVDEELRDQIVEQAKFKYIPEVITVG